MMRRPRHDLRVAPVEVRLALAEHGEAVVAALVVRRADVAATAEGIGDHDDAGSDCPSLSFVSLASSGGHRADVKKIPTAFRLCSGASDP